MENLGDIIKFISDSGTWVRYFFMFTTAALATYLTYKSGQTKIQSSSINALQKDLEIKDNRVETLISEVKRYEEKSKALELEAAALKAKTDLTEVLKMLGNLSETFGREHTSNLEMLQIVVKSIQEQQTASVKHLEANNQILTQVFQYVKDTWHETPRGKRTGRQSSS